MTITLIILAVTAVFFIWGKIRADLVALSALVLLMLFGILTPAEALSGFSSPVATMLAGVFIVGGAVFRTGLAKIISRKILDLAGQSETRLFFLIMLATSGLGAFVSNTGTVAVMLPIVVSLTASAGTSPSRILLPLAFASTMGGMFTLIGATPNLIVNGTLTKAGYPSLHFFSFFPIGVICVTVGTLTLAVLSKWLLVKKGDKGKARTGAARPLKDLANKYRLMENEHRARVRKDSPIVGQTLSALQWPETYGCATVEIRRKATVHRLFNKPVRQILPRPDTVIQPQDVISLIGPPESVRQLAEDARLALIDDTDAASNPEYKYAFDEMGIAEVVILSTSHLVKRTIKESGLRAKYGINVLGIQRRNETILQNIRDVVITPGDALLVQGSWKDIGRLGEERNEWVVVGRPLESASMETLDHKAPLAGLIVLLMILSMALNILPPVTAVLLASLCLIFSGCFRNAEEAYKAINWENIVLVAAMLPISLAVEKTGAAALASQALIRAVGDMGPHALLAGVYVMTSCTTMVLSNTATAALCAPIALQAALGSDLSPYPFIFGVATAAAMSLATPFSTPPNVLVMSPGRYVFMDYIKVGGPLQLLFAVVMVFALPLLFPFAKAG